MADKKISQLPAATTPLAGTEVLPIVQSSTTDQVSVANLTAGRDVSMANATITSAAPITTIQSTSATAAKLILKDTGTTNNLVIGSSGQTLYIQTGGAQRITIDSAGNTNILTGNLVPNTAAKGVDFTANTPAAGMTSQLLNWYEEGTFTPTVEGSTTAGTTTYGTRSGWYTRIGNQVTVQIVLNVTSMSGTGNIKIGALPFTIKAGTQGVGSAMTDSLDWASGTSITPYLPGGNAYMLLFTSGDNIGWAAVAVDSAWEAVITATYFV